MPETPLRIAYLTAGAGGMYCGSCMNDNTLVRELMLLGLDVQLVPTYTPISTDEKDVSVDQVFFGGINVFLQQKMPWIRYLPPALDGILNHPALIRWATKKDVQADPDLLGGMTVSMLKGKAGFQRKEVTRLVRWLENSAKPQIVNFSNILIAGCAPELKEKLGTRIVVTLQGDDIFLDFIPPKYRKQAIAEIQRLTSTVDAFIVHSHYYADFMQDLLGIPAARVHVVPLGIDTADFSAVKRPSAARTGLRQIGYLARLTPEKGLHILVNAFIQLRQQRNDVALKIAGWLGTEHQSYADQQFDKLRRAGLEDHFEYVGVVNLQQKIDFLAELDLFSVPTTYREPKGRFALEAIASGLPVVLPNHGAFPEILANCPGGSLHHPGDAAALAEQLNRLLDDPTRAAQFSREGQAAALQLRSAAQMAQATMDVYRNVMQ